MKEQLKNIEESIEKFEVSFEDISELEEIVTPGVGTGCNCTAQ